MSSKTQTIQEQTDTNDSRRNKSDRGFTFGGFIVLYTLLTTI